MYKHKINIKNEKIHVLENNIDPSTPLCINLWATIDTVVKIQKNIFKALHLQLLYHLYYFLQ